MGSQAQGRMAERAWVRLSDTIEGSSFSNVSRTGVGWGRQVGSFVAAMSEIRCL